MEDEKNMHQNPENPDFFIKILKSWTLLKNLGNPDKILIVGRSGQMKRRKDRNIWESGTERWILISLVIIKDKIGISEYFSVEVFSFQFTHYIISSHE